MFEIPANIDICNTRIKVWWFGYPGQPMTELRATRCWVSIDKCNAQIKACWPGYTRQPMAELRVTRCKVSIDICNTQIKASWPGYPCQTMAELKSVGWFRSRELNVYVACIDACIYKALVFPKGTVGILKAVTNCLSRKIWIPFHLSVSANMHTYQSLVRLHICWNWKLERCFDF